MDIVGRTKEIKKLAECLNEQRAHFIAVYGRRRIGKTFLIREFFSKKARYLEVTGTKGGDTQVQIDSFLSCYEKLLGKGIKLSRDQTWREVLSNFTEHVKKTKTKFVLFIDELPWLVTARSGLLEEIDYFWNTQWSQLANFKIIVCGSASSWMIEKILHNTGGLYNRITGSIHLKPFLLSEVEEYYKKKKFIITRRQIIELYLAFGGVPYYLDFLDKNQSPSENINSLIFSQDAELYQEYDFLMESLFRNSDHHQGILNALAKNRYGLSRADIAKAIGKQDGGGLDRYLSELAACNFISEYVPFGKKKQGAYFRLVDEYIIFYKYFLQPLRSKGIKTPKDYWLKNLNTPKYNSLMGYNFETLCQKHVDSILEALSIAGMQVEVSTWNCKPKNKEEQGMQIDLVLDRADRVVSLCEIKYSRDPLVINSRELKKYSERSSLFKHYSKTRKAVNSILISNAGVIANSNLESAFVKVLTGEDLFR